MNDLLTLLYYLNQHNEITQRELAQATDVSLGKVNLILKKLEEGNYIHIQKINGKTVYQVTSKGFELLEQDRRDIAKRKLRLRTQPSQVKLAVILAAGQPRGIDLPIPLVSIGEECILDRTLMVLRHQGIERFIVVAGYKAELLSQHTANWAHVTIVENSHYATTGTMASLAVAAPHIQEDFLLVEGDLLFEIRGTQHLLNSANSSALLITSVRLQHDEAMVEVRDGYIYKMGKDIHQFNQIDGEMIGLSKLSYPFYQKMLAIYANNTNPWVNYEYLMLDVAQEYRLGYVKLDDYVWGEIDEVGQQYQVTANIYPRIQAKERQDALDQVKVFLTTQLQVAEADIQLIESAGGMTNRNYKVVFNQQAYIVRIAGNGTEKFIQRAAEKSNSLLAHILGLDVETVYFDEQTGIKVSRFIEEAETLNQNTATYPQNMQLTTRLLRQLHHSGMDFANRFDVFQEIVKYEQFIDELNAEYFADYAVIRPQVMTLEAVLAQLPQEIVPCHIDTVPENFVKGADQQSYLIDWEYSGMNDRAWDLAAHCLECDFDSQQTEQFLKLYFEQEAVSEAFRQKMLIYQICQDFLWSVWTIFKESRGDQFGDYGQMRYDRAKANLKRYQQLYPTVQKGS